MNNIKYLLIALRPKQWVKNLLIFLAPIFSKQIFIYPVNLKSLISFFLFSLAAGTAYLINDLLDLKKDMFHSVKRSRPIASGKLKIRDAKIAILVLGGISIGTSFAIDIYFGWIVVTYLLFNILYSAALKNTVIIDVLCIGFFFLLRVMAGSIIAGVQMSHWLIFMTVLLALFLGFNKRRQELRLVEHESISHRAVLTKYSAYFIDQMIAVITSSIVVVYMLYAVDNKTISFFGTDHLIYTIPFVYYGIFRYLYLVHKVYKDEEDPTEILFADTKMQLNLILWLTVCVAVIYFKL